MLKRSGSKGITVDGNRYRYVVSEVGNGSGTDVPISIVVQDDRSNGARVLVRGLATRRDPNAPGRNFQGRAVGRPVGPRDAAAAVQLAIKAGWEPTNAGPPFTLRTSNAKLFGATAVA